MHCSGIRSFKCNLVPKQCNKVADTLANVVKDIQPEVWLNQSPRFLVHVLLLDAD